MKKKKMMQENKPNRNLTKLPTFFFNPTISGGTSSNVFSVFCIINFFKFFFCVEILNYLFH